MCALHDNISGEHIREKRARLPQPHEMDYHECVDFQLMMKYVQEEDDEHFQAVQPHIPVVQDDAQFNRGQIVEQSEDDDMELEETHKLQQQIITNQYGMMH